MPARTYEEIDSIATRMKSAGAPDDEVRQYVTLAMQEMGGKADPVDKIPGDLNVFSFTEDIKRGKQEALRAGREDVVEELSRREQEFAGLKAGDKFTLPSGEDVYKVDETTYASQPIKISTEETIKREIPITVLSGGGALKLAGAAAARFTRPIAKTIAGLIGGATGGYTTEKVARWGLGEVRPEALRELERAEAENPEAALLANVVGGGLPYQKLGSTAARTIMEDIAPRAIGAGALSGIQAGVEYLPEGDAREGALRRVLLAGGAGFALNEPTGLGNKLLGVKPVAKPSTPITDNLGNASTKNTTMEANQAANAIAIQPPVPAVPPIDLSQINPAGAQAVDLMAQLGRAPELAGLPPGAPRAVTGIGGEERFFAEGRVKPAQVEKAATDAAVADVTTQPVSTAERAATLEGLMPRQQASKTVLAERLRAEALRAEADARAKVEAQQAEAAGARMADELRAEIEASDDPIEAAFEAGRRAAAQAEAVTQARAGTERVVDDLAFEAGREGAIAAETKLQREAGRGRLREIKAPEKKSGVLAGESPTIIKPLEVAGVGEPPKPTIRQIELEGGAQGQGLIVNSGITDAQGNPIWVNVRTGRAVEAPTYQGPRPGGEEPPMPGSAAALPPPKPKQGPSGAVPARPARDWRKQKVSYIGDQELGEGQFMPLYNLAEDIVDDAGKVLHPAGSTVSADTLKRYGIAAPEAPKPHVESVSRPSGEGVATSVSTEAQMPVKPKETPVPAAPEVKPAPAQPAKSAAAKKTGIPTDEELNAASLSQRGIPEDTMDSTVRALQKAGGPAVLNDLLEHVGDLAHRLQEPGHFGSTAPEKVRKLLRLVKPPKGYMDLAQEIEHGIQNNAEFRVLNRHPELEAIEGPAWKKYEALREKYQAEIDAEKSAIRKAMQDELPAYVKAHEEHNLPTTYAGQLGKEAAIALGNLDFPRLTKIAEELDEILKKVGGKKEIYSRENPLKPAAAAPTEAMETLSNKDALLIIQQTDARKRNSNKVRSDQQFSELTSQKKYVEALNRLNELIGKPKRYAPEAAAEPKRVPTTDEAAIEAEAARQAEQRGLQTGIVGNQATTAAAGGVIGYATGDDQEDRLQRAAIGAAIGAGVGGAATAAMRPGVRQAIKQGFEEAAKQRAAVPEVKPDVTRPAPIQEAGLSKQTAEWNRIIERNARLREQRRPPTGEEIYKKLTEDSAENNTSPAPKEVADDIAKAAPNYQPLLTDLASRFPSWAKWFPGAQTISDVVGLVARGTKVAMGQVTSNLRERLPEAAGLLEDRAYRLAEITNNWTQRGLKYDELARKNLTPEEYQKFDIATQNGDVEGALAVIKGNKAEAELRQAYDEAIALREEVRESLIERGIEVGDVGSAFPRSVWDRKGLLKALGSDATSKYDDMVREAVKSKGSKLSEDEEIELMNQFLSRARGMAGKPGFLKGRRIEEIDAELYPFYEHGGVAMKRYLDRAAQYMLNQEFFGKARPDFAKDEGIGGSIGAALVKGLNSRKINSDDLERLSTVLRRYFRFDYQMGGEMANVANKLRNIQTFGMLADISTAAVQFADIFNIMYGYGLKGLPGYFRTGKGRIKLEDINVFEGHNVELADLSRLAQNKGPIRRAIRKAYELPLRHLLGASDAINKGGLINSAHRYWSDMVNQPNREPFKRMDEWYREMYPERWDAILADLRKPEFARGELNDNTRFFLRNELARWQPIDLAQRAEGYAGAPAPLRLFYTLRSYAIAQQNIIRRDVYEAAKKGDYWRAIANMAFYAGAVGVGQQLFRAGMDKMLNRQIESPEEYALQGFMQLMLVPRYTIYRLKEQGPYVAAAEWLVPGANIPADITKDMMSFAKYATDQRDKKGYRTVPSLSDLGKELETTKYIPAVGREIYWMAGKGASKTEKLREQESKGKERPGSYDVIQSLFVPPDLK